MEVLQYRLLRPSTMSSLEEHLEESTALVRTASATPAPITAAVHSQVREPTADEVSCWTTVADVMKWAKLRGEVDWPPSMAGSLLRLFADEDDLEDLMISEVASV